MDPITATSVAASAIAFVDFGIKLVSTTTEAYRSKSGATARHLELSALAVDLSMFSRGIEGKLDSLADHSDETAKLLRGYCQECQIIKRDIDTAIEEMKLEGKSKLDLAMGSFVAAFRGLRSEAKVAGLEKRLSRLKGNITICTLLCLWYGSGLICMRIQAVTMKANKENRGETSKRNEAGQLMGDRLKCIADEVDSLEDKTTHEFVRSLDQDVKSTRQEPNIAKEELIDTYWNTDWDLDGLGIEDTSISSHADQYKAYDQNRIRALLNSLRFDGSGHREAMIPTAHMDTFEWLFNPADDLGFQKWLEAKPESVFWITGKPGSGKSTLMKFIGTDSRGRTRQHLRKWSGDQQLLVASFYFWDKGEHSSTTTEGLLTLLLHQCLSQRPDLIPIVAPKRWAILNIFDFGMRLPPWSMRELQECFRMMALRSDKEFKLAIFIDGLDEFRGDQKGLARLVRELCRDSGIKCCVSSRPENVFSDAFSQSPSLTMQLLTKADIDRYVRDEFDKSRGFQELKSLFPDEAQKFLSDIADKAQGVFLWVAIVVRALLSCAEEEPRLATLQRVLSSLPSGIADLYGAIWAKIDGDKMSSASKLFQILAKSPWTLDCLDVWLADEDNIPDTDDGTVSKGVSSDKLAPIMRRILSSNSKGIVEMSPSYNIDFLHRTAREWVQRPVVWTEIRAKAPPNFHPLLALIRSFVHKICAATEWSEFLEFDPLRVMSMATWLPPSHPAAGELVLLLDKLDRKMRGLWPAKPGNWTEQYFRTGSIEGISFFHLAVLLGVAPYVQAKMSSINNSRNPGNVVYQPLRPTDFQDKLNNLFNRPIRPTLLDLAVFGWTTVLGRSSNLDYLSSSHMRVYLETCLLETHSRLETVRFLVDYGADSRLANASKKLTIKRLRERHILPRPRYTYFESKRSAYTESCSGKEGYWKDVLAILDPKSGVANKSI